MNGDRLPGGSETDPYGPTRGDSTDGLRQPNGVGGRHTYPLAADTWGDEEVESAIAVLRSRRVTMGERVQAFETEFASWIGARHAIMVNSGSSANLLMVDALLRRTEGRPPLLPGDEVMVPALAWPTTVWPLVQLGLIPVWVDVDQETLGLDLDSAAQAIGPRTKGMFLIHPLGRALEMDSYRRFNEKHSLTLIEDACEALGGHWAGRQAGTVGQSGSFSFYFSHHLSTIEGGMIVTEDMALLDDFRSLRSHGWSRDRSDRDRFQPGPQFDERFLFVMPGYNVRPTEIQAAIGSVQLRRLDHMLEARESLARDVAAWLSRRVPWLELIGAELLDAAPSSRRQRGHSWMTLPLRLQDGAPMSRNRAMGHLEAMGVETRPLIAGNLARHPAAQGIPARQAPSLHRSDDLLSRAFMIGCHPGPSSHSRETLEAAVSSLGAF